MMQAVMASREIRALISLTVASLTPGIAAWAMSQGGGDPVDAMLGVVVWSMFSVLVVVPVGMLSYLALRRSRIPFLISGPIVGGLVGAAVAYSLYRQGFSQEQLMYFTVQGALTGFVAVALEKLLARMSAAKH